MLWGSGSPASYMALEVVQEDGFIYKAVFVFAVKYWMY